MTDLSELIERVSDERLAEIVATANYAGDDADLWLSSAEGRALAAELQSLRSAREAEPVAGEHICDDPNATPEQLRAYCHNMKRLYSKELGRRMALEDLHPSPSTEGLGVRERLRAIIDRTGPAASGTILDAVRGLSDIEQIARSALSALSTSAEQVITDNAQFLIDRLDDFERGSLGDSIEDACRDFDGHISPAIERLRAALEGSQSSER